MEFKRVDEKKLLMSGYKGEFFASYNSLIEALGESTGPSSDGKCQAEWSIEFEDGTLASIYDWKENKPVEEVTEWHIGGFSKRAVELVVKQFKQFSGLGLEIGITIEEVK